LARLVARLQSPTFAVFIHIDKKTDISPFLFIRRFKNVHFVKKRFKIVWGGYSITECIISGMKEILGEGNYTHIVSMSGQDYPIRPVVQFENLLADNKDFSFMHVEPNTRASRWWQNAVPRYTYYYLSDFDFRGKRFLHKIGRRILPKRNFIYPHYRLFGGPGSTFCALSREACEYIVNFMEGNKKGRNYAKYTFASDEFWFQTILMNSSLRFKVINQPLWYMEWEGSSKHPRILNMMDYGKIVESGLYFARKFDMLNDEMILDQLDDILSQRARLQLSM
ncbi:MAG TPA: beta-1,6-N-acetylglucosaminyltransferase, partial [Flavitalea sp.]|nr:beta-1,6-N-acetylglucosaminyltransferase [Flavitalea sp.]